MISLHLDVADSAVARRAFRLLREVGVRSELRTYRQRAFDGRRATSFTLREVPRTLRVLHEAGILDASHAPLERPPRRVTGRACCRRAYLRGALLGGGSLSGPRSPHLEIRAAGTSGADFLSELGRRERLGLKSSTAAVTPSRTRRAPARSPTCSRAPARATRCSSSRNARSSARRGRARTGLRTRTTRTSSEPRVRLTCS